MKHQDVMEGQSYLDDLTTANGAIPWLFWVDYCTTIMSFLRLRNRDV